MSNFPTWWAFCQRPENDGSADDTTTDGAGTTRWGWTFATWLGARRYIGAAATWDIFMAMTQEQAGVLANVYFWNRQGGLLVRSGPDVVVIDWAWVSGGGVREIQYHLGLKQNDLDGIVGPHTANSINAANPTKFINDCTGWRKNYYDLLGYRDQFPGLYTRTDAICQIGLSLVKVAAK